MISPIADQVKFEELDLHGLFKREVSYGGRFVESCVPQLSLVPRFEWHPSFSLSYLGKMISVAKESLPVYCFRTFPLLISINRKRGKTIMRDAVIKIYLSANIWFYRLRVVLLWFIRWSVFFWKDGTGGKENQRYFQRSLRINNIFFNDSSLILMLVFIPRFAKGLLSKRNQTLGTLLLPSRCWVPFPCSWSWPLQSSSCSCPLSLWSPGPLHFLCLPTKSWTTFFRGRDRYLLRPRWGHCWLGIAQTCGQCSEPPQVSGHPHILKLKTTNIDLSAWTDEEIIIPFSWKNWVPNSFSIFWHSVFFGFRRVCQLLIQKVCNRDTDTFPPTVFKMIKFYHLVNKCYLVANSYTNS